MRSMMTCSCDCDGPECALPPPFADSVKWEDFAALAGGSPASATSGSEARVCMITEQLLSTGGDRVTAGIVIGRCQLGGQAEEQWLRHRTGPRAVRRTRSGTCPAACSHLTTPTRLLSYSSVVLRRACSRICSHAACCVSLTLSW